MTSSTLFKGLLAATLLLGAPGAAVAQEGAPAPTQTAPAEISETQIDRFVSAYQAIQTIQQSVQADLVAAVEAEGLTVDDYNAIAEAQQSPETATQVDPAQAEQFAAAAAQVATLREEARADMQAAIAAEDLSLAEFEQILAQAQQDPALQQTITERLAQ
jgi:predicted RNA-binding Zn ribbon-like protein